VIFLWSSIFRFKYGGVEVYFGPGALRENIISKIQSYRRVLVVTSRSAARISGALIDVERALRDCSVEYTVYSNVKPNPDTSTANIAAEIARGISAEAIIGIGGGSVIDVAKVISITAKSKVRAEEVSTRRVEALEALPLIIINLTHGTGSEVNRFAVLTLSGTIEKRGFVARYPSVSFDDPLYTTTLNAKQTLYTTIDAFYHAYESATSKRTNLLAISLAEIAIANISEYLRRALEDPSNLESRTRLLYASMLAGISVDITGGSHLNHAIEHGFSGLNPELPHGAGLAMFGPMVVYYTHKVVPEISARLLRNIDPSIKPTSDDAERAKRAVEEFQEVHGFNERLNNYGISEEDIVRVVDFIVKAISERYHILIPFPTSRELVLSIVKSAL